MCSPPPEGACRVRSSTSRYTADALVPPLLRRYGILILAKTSVPYSSVSPESPSRSRPIVSVAHAASDSVPMEEPRHGEHVAARLPSFGADGVDAAAHEHPQRLLQVVGTQLCRFAWRRPTAARRTTAGLPAAACPSGPRSRLLLKIENVEVLAVAVVVEIAIRVIECDGFPVFGRQRVVASGRQRLSERRAVLEREPRLRPAPLAPRPPCLCLTTRSPCAPRRRRSSSCPRIPLQARVSPSPRFSSLPAWLSRSP